MARGREYIVFIWCCCYTHSDGYLGETILEELVNEAQRRHPWHLLMHISKREESRK